MYDAVEIDAVVEIHRHDQFRKEESFARAQRQLVSREMGEHEEAIAVRPRDSGAGALLYQVDDGHTPNGLWEGQTVSKAP